MPNVHQGVLDNFMLFLNPDIGHLAIPLSPDEFMVGMICEEASVRLPNLESLEMRFGASGMSMKTIHDRVVPFLYGLQTLKEIVLPYLALTSEIVTALSTLPNLHAIDSLDEDDNHGAALDVTPFLPKLQDGSFLLLKRYSFAGSLADLARLLKTKTSPWLLTHLSILMIEAERSLHLREVLETLSQSSTELLQLTIEPYVSNTTSSVGDEDTESYTVTLSTLRPLTRFSDLETLNVACLNAVQICDADFDWLMRHFPHLRDLQLIGGDNAFQEGGSLTICAISVLARCCPQLRNIMLDLKGTLPSDVDAGSGECSLSAASVNPSFLPYLETLDVGISSIGEPVSQIAIYLSNFLPAECVIKAQTDVPKGSEAQTEADRQLLDRNRMWAMRWEEVGQLVPLLAKTRRYERAKIARKSASTELKE